MSRDSWLVFVISGQPVSTNLLRVHKDMENPADSVEVNTLNKLVETIQEVRYGLDPEVLADWYSLLEMEAKSLCPSSELRESIKIIQNPDLPMKFEFKSSKRAIPFVIEAVENNLNIMPFATRLYFQKFEEIIQEELKAYLTQNPT